MKMTKTSKEMDIYKSHVDMIKFKFETSCYGNNKTHLNFIYDILELQTIIATIMEELLERTKPTKEKK